MKRYKLTTTAATMLVVLSCSLLATETKARHVTASGSGNHVDVDFTAMVSAMSTNTAHVKDEVFSSFDLVADLSTHSGLWRLYVEGNTSPRAQGVSEFF